jgi:dienelactone hydrolase
MINSSLLNSLKCCLIVLFLGLTLSLGFPRGNITSFAFQQSVIGQPQNQLVGRSYLPDSSQDPHPTVILCHGVSSHKDTMTPLAVELAKQGIAAITFDFGGYGESYSRPLGQSENLADVQSILRWVKGDSRFDVSRLGIVGHSMGGTTALETALAEDNFKATVLLGIGGNATPSSPKNLMFGTGVYEQLNPTSEMRTLFASAIEQPSDAIDKTARSFIISPTADHAIAPYDPFLITKTVEWFQRALMLTNQPVRVTYPVHLVGLSLCWIATLGLSILVCQLLQSRCSYLLPLFVFSSVSVISLLCRWPIAGWFTILVIPSLVVANYLQRNQKSLLELACRISVYGLALYSAYLICLVLHSVAVGSLLESPSAIMQFPTLMIYTPFVVAYNQIYDFYYAVSNVGSLPVNFILIALMIVAESYRQGFVLDTIDRWTKKLSDVIRQPIRLQIESSATPKSMIVVCVALFIVLTIVLIQQGQAGLLTGDAFLLVGRLIGFFVLLPAFLMVLLLRSSIAIRTEK